MKVTPLITSVAFSIPVLAVLSAIAQPYDFTTLVGRPGVDSLDGTNTAARFGHPAGAATDSSGNIYISDSYSQTLRKMTLVGTNWVVTTIAGLAGQSGSADGTNSDARFYGPAGIAVDNATNLYVADSYNHTIRKVSPVGTNWVVTTIAGQPGVSVPYGTDGTGSFARFYYPQGVAVDNAGNAYVADSGNNTIRKLALSGAYAVVSTLAGWAGEPFSPGMGAGTSDGTNSDARFHSPAGVLWNGSTLFVTDNGNHTVRRLDLIGTNCMTTTLAGQAGIPGSADGLDFTAQFHYPGYIASDNSGNLYISDVGNDTVRKLTAVGTDWSVTTLVGTPGLTGSADGINGAARFNSPNGVALDGAGNIYVADYNNGIIREVSPTGSDWVVRTVAGALPTGFGQVYGVASDSSGNLYVPDYSGNTIWQLRATAGGWVAGVIAGNGAPGVADGTNSGAQFNGPMGIAVDSATNLYVADYLNSTIRKVSPIGTNWAVTTIAGTAGNFFVGVDGTNGAARFIFPSGIALDNSGTLYVADQSDNAIRMVRRYGGDWVVTTIAGVASFSSTGHADGTNSNARFAWPAGITADAATNLYVADTGSSTIRRITPIGTNWVVTTIAGVSQSIGSTDGPGQVARFRSPSGISLAPDGNLFVADTWNDTIRKMTLVGTNWIVSTVGGLPGVTGASDGTGTQARFNNPKAVYVDPSGNVFVADTVSHTIRLGQPVPSIDIALVGGQTVLSWPLFATNYLLETSSRMLPNATWLPVTGTPAISGSWFVVTNTAAFSQAFFRLHKP